MKVLNRLTIKHLMMNKKRTIVTIIGIVLSTSLMVGIGLLLSTFLYSMQLDAIEYNGSHHAYFDGITKEEKETLDLNVNFSKTYSYGIVGYAKVENENTYKPYFYIVSGDKSILETETLLEGKFPESKEEIVIPDHLQNYKETKYKIGDEITLDIGPRIIEEEEVYNNNVSYTTIYDETGKTRSGETLKKEKTKTYKIVGIIKRSKKEDYSAPGFMAYTTEENDIAYYRTYGELKNVRKVYDLKSEICETLNKNATCATNDNLLYYYGISRYGNVNRAIVSVLTIGLTLLSVGCIIVIYNSFAISTMERKKSFGLYSSLGATPRQLKYTVFFEALVVGTLGIILGIVAAFLGIYVTVNILDHLVGDTWGMTLKFVVDPLYITIPIIFMIGVVYLSAFIPAKRSSKVSSIEMIRENDEIKIPRKKVCTPKWIHKLFGMEGEIALKNMKRNKRKYRITLLSLFISIVLFISFSTYLTLGLKLTDIGDKALYDIYVNTNDIDTIEDIINREEVEKSYRIKQQSVAIKMEEKQNYQKNFYEFYEAMYKDEDEEFPAVEVILEDKDFKELEKLVSKKNTPILYNQLNYTFYESNSRKSFQTKMFEKDRGKLTICSYKEEGCQDLEITMINETIDFIRSLPVENSMPILLLSKSMIEKDSILEVKEKQEFLAIQSKEYKNLYESIDKKYNNQSGFYAFSPKIELEEQKNSMLAIKILLYGFITLVTLTGVTSVFNTIHTSIHLRKKEFAMLRSVGLSPKGFNKMIFFESLFFGLKSLLYSLPVSFGIVYLINISIGDAFSFGTIVVPWNAVIIAILGVFLIILATMWYSVSKIKKENILNSLRDENI